MIYPILVLLAGAVKFKVVGRADGKGKEFLNECYEYKYALACTDESNEKVGRYIKKQAFKWLEIADGKSNVSYVSGKEWGRIKGILTLMIHPGTGQNMLLSRRPSLYDPKINTVNICAIFSSNNFQYKRSPEMQFINLCPAFRGI